VEDESWADAPGTAEPFAEPFAESFAEPAAAAPVVVPRLLPLPSPSAHDRLNAAPTRPVPEPAIIDASAEPHPDGAHRPRPRVLTPAIDILPRRSSLRSALRLGRNSDTRSRLEVPAGYLPPDVLTSGGLLDPPGIPKEYSDADGAYRSDAVRSTSTSEAAGDTHGTDAGDSAHHPDGAAGTPGTEAGDVAGGAGYHDSVPATLLPIGEPTASPEPTAAPGPAGEAGRNTAALTSEALTELSRLSYNPASMDTLGAYGLQRRTPGGVPTEPEPAVGSAGQRARTAANVRSMLAGFRAGAERGRTSPSAGRAVPEPRSRS
jgi:hypothetical protein